jgi:hypothetical protein
VVAAAARAGTLGASYPDRMDAGAEWSNAGAAGGCPFSRPGWADDSIDAKCPHPKVWFYPRNDAFMGLTCQVRGAAGAVSKCCGN